MDNRSRVVRKLKDKFDEISKFQNRTSRSSNDKIVNYFNEIEYISKGNLVNEKTAYLKNKFNQLVSDSIPSDRSIPDTRFSLCKTINYEINKLPSTSISM